MHASQLHRFLQALTFPYAFLSFSGDVSGSLEAIINIVSSFVSRDLKLNVITAAVGNVNENDLNMADTFDGKYFDATQS